jgi:microcompartment protein CcmL/EutN
MVVMERAIGTFELISVARGVATVDAMLKAANVKLFHASPICPGKYLIVVWGQVGAVRNALNAGKQVAEEMLTDEMLLPNVHPSVFPALACTTEVGDMGALGVVEALAAPCIIEAADAAAKAAKVVLIEIRLGRGMGAKSFFSMGGDISEVKIALTVAKELVASKGLLVDTSFIPNPHPDLKGAVL